jgi:hypothetical protein
MVRNSGPFGSLASPLPSILDLHFDLFRLRGGTGFEGGSAGFAAAAFSASSSSAANRATRCSSRIRSRNVGYRPRHHAAICRRLSPKLATLRTGATGRVQKLGSGEACIGRRAHRASRENSREINNPKAKRSPELTDGCWRDFSVGGCLVSVRRPDAATRASSVVGVCYTDRGTARGSVFSVGAANGRA